MDGHHGHDDDGGFDDPNKHEHAIVELSGRYRGAKGTFNVWRPFVESTTETSISQLWVTRMYDDDNVATLEAGWMVYADLFGDNRVRYFCFTTLENGDVVDCVDFYSQPAMRNHHVRKLCKYELQSRARLPPRETTTTEFESHGSLSDNISGIGLKEKSCPPGSVPFLKATKSGPLNYSAIDNFARSRARFFHMRSNSTKLLMDGHHSDDDDGGSDDPNMHEAFNSVYSLFDDGQSYSGSFGKAKTISFPTLIGLRHAIVELSGRFGGAKGSFNVWKPFVESTTEASISQLWVVRKYHDGNIATLEAGWMPDKYASTLYNVHRRRPVQNNLVFTQVSERFFPGGVIRDISDYDGRQREVDLKIKKDLETGNWKLSFNRETVGFWLRTNYHPDFDLADEIQWGGEIVNERMNGRHTSTQMGSGHFGREGMGKAAYIRHMEVYDRDLNPSDAAYPLIAFANDPLCYDINDWGRTPMGRMITFGGPGYDAHLCP
ncbi:hypothetical protein EJ110_NYTH31818 [Nymphaea thermarum]|nr:hypothetical protein EJ110_NYTH31818 [Nymphaea thermarum]